MKRALKNKKRNISKVHKSKKKNSSLASSKKMPEVPKPLKETKVQSKQPDVPKPEIQKKRFFSNLFKNKKANNPLEEIKKHLGNKNGLIKKEEVKLNKFIKDKERKEKREIDEIKGLAFGIRNITPRAKKIQVSVPRIEEKHIQIKPSPIYEVHIIDDLPDPYQLELSRTARKNKALKKLMTEEEMLKKKMSELEGTQLVYYKI